MYIHIEPKVIIILSFPYCKSVQKYTYILCIVNNVELDNSKSTTLTSYFCVNLNIIIQVHLPLLG